MSLNPSSARAGHEVLHTRRKLIAGLGVVGVCAIAGSSLLPGRANATTLMSSTIDGLGRNAGDAVAPHPEFEHADLNADELAEAELIEVRRGRRRRRSVRRRGRRRHARRWHGRRRHHHHYYYARPRWRGRSLWRFCRDFPLACISWWL